MEPAPVSGKAALPHVRSAWFVNLLAFVTLAIVVCIVLFVKLDSEADVFVLIGVSGSAYIVLQIWSMLQCIRAIQKSDRFAAPFFALAASLLFFNATVLVVALPYLGTLDFIRNAFNPTALPIFIPVLTLSTLLALPIAHFISRKYPLSHRATSFLRLGILAFLVLVLLPVPLFTYVSQFVGNRDSDSKDAESSEFWAPLVRITPEFVADAAFVVSQREWQPGMLRSGRMSKERLLAEVTYYRGAADALQGLLRKDRNAALEGGLAMARRPVRGSFGVMEAMYTIADIVMEVKTQKEIEAMLRDSTYVAPFREALFERYRHAYPNNVRELSEELFRGCEFDEYYVVSRVFVDQHTDEEILQVWRDSLRETDPQRAQRRAYIYRKVPARLRANILQMALTEGTDAVKSGTLQALCSRNHLPEKSEQSDAIFYLCLELLEKTESEPRTDTLRYDACCAILTLVGRSRTIPDSKLKDEVFVKKWTREMRARVPFKNSASQPAPSE